MNREWVIGPVLVAFNIASVLLLLPVIAAVTAYKRLRGDDK